MASDGVAHSAGTDGVDLVVANFVNGATSGPAESSAGATAALKNAVLGSAMEAPKGERSAAAL